MPEEFLMRGKTESGETEVLNFSGYKPGYAYRVVAFDMYGSTVIGTNKHELLGTISAGKTAIVPTDPDFSDEALIGVSYYSDNESDAYGPITYSVLNDLFLITQELILMVQDTGGGNRAANWQIRFVGEKMNKSQEAVANYKQYLISDG